MGVEALVGLLTGAGVFTGRLVGVAVFAGVKVTVGVRIGAELRGVSVGIGKVLVGLGVWVGDGLGVGVKVGTRVKVGCCVWLEKETLIPWGASGSTGRRPTAMPSPICNTAMIKRTGATNQ
jgi:hypothetical protein